MERNYQRQFKGNWVASVSFLGNETTHLWIAEERDPAEYIPETVLQVNTASLRPVRALRRLTPTSAYSVPDKPATGTTTPASIRGRRSGGPLRGPAVIGDRIV